MSITQRTDEHPAPNRNASAARAGTMARAVLARGLSRYGLIVAWIIVIVIFGTIEPSGFLSLGNASTILGTESVILIISLGLLAPLLCGDFDLSIGGTTALSAMSVAILNANHGWPIWLCAIVGVAEGIVVGAVNGIIGVKFQIDPFIVTLGMSTVLQGIVLWISGSNTISGVSTAFSNFVNYQLLGIHVIFYLTMAAALVWWYVLSYTPFGRRLLYVGKGRRAAELVGVKVGRTRVIAFVISGAAAGAAGVVYAGLIGSADPTSALDFLLPAFAAAFLGATAFRPGIYNVWGTVVGAYFLISGVAGLQLLGASTYVQDLFYGVALVGAVVLSGVVSRRTRRGF